MAANSTYQHRDKTLHITFSHFFLVSFVLKAKLYLFSALQVLHLKWEYGEVSLLCYPIWPRLSDHNLEKILCGGLLGGWWMNCRGKKQVALEGMELLCALLAWAPMCFEPFSQFSPTWSLTLFGRSSLFFPINHLWHTTGIFLFLLCSRSALSRDRKACTVSSSRRSENVWKMYGFDFLICFMQEMFCYCSLTSCLINASQAHHQSLSSFFPKILFFSSR